MPAEVTPHGGYWRRVQGGWGWIKTGSSPASFTVPGGYSEAQITNPEVTPDGKPNPSAHPAPPPPNTNKPAPYGGYWAPSHGGGWSWVPTGDTPMPPHSTSGVSWEDLTNPKHPPGSSPANPNFTRDPTYPDGSPNPYYIATDVNAPTLTVQPGWPPDLTGDVPPPPDSSNGDNKPHPPPSHPEWTMDGSSLVAGEKAILSSAGIATTEYESLVSYVASTKWWIFSAPSADALNVTTRAGTVVYDPNLATTRQLSAASDNLLLNTADAIKAAAAYVEAVNRAGQLYSRADLDSFVPES
jgi:hypothetical protein